MSLHDLVMCFNPAEAESILRKTNINVLYFYLCGFDIRANFIVLNQAAAEILKDKKVRGRRRELLERFIGRVAGLRLIGDLKMEVPWQDLVKEQ